MIRIQLYPYELNPKGPPKKNNSRIRELFTKSYKNKSSQYSRTENIVCENNDVIFVRDVGCQFDNKSYVNTGRATRDPQFKKP